MCCSSTTVVSKFTATVAVFALVLLGVLIPLTFIGFFDCDGLDRVRGICEVRGHVLNAGAVVSYGVRVSLDNATYPEIFDIPIRCNEFDTECRARQNKSLEAAPWKLGHRGNCTVVQARSNSDLDVLHWSHLPAAPLMEGCKGMPEALISMAWLLGICILYLWSRCRRYVYEVRSRRRRFPYDDARPSYARPKAKPRPQQQPQQQQQQQQPQQQQQQQQQQDWQPTKVLPTFAPTSLQTPKPSAPPAEDVDAAVCDDNVSDYDGEMDVSFSV